MDRPQNRKNQGPFEQIGESLGETAGRVFGRGGDLAADVLGSLIGSAMGSLSDWWSSSDATRAAQSFDQEKDRTCEQHFTSSDISSSRDYADVRPLYQFGHVASQNPDYQGLDFTDVEPDLQRAWTDESVGDLSDWSEVRDYVDFGYKS